MSSLSLPFYADAATLPAELPSIDEIQASPEVFLDYGSRKVVGVGQHFIVKFGPQVDITEGEVLFFLQRSTSIRAPKLYALFKDPSNPNKNFIIMERIPGKTLEAEWDFMDQRAKNSIATKLRALFEEIKRLPSPGSYCNLMRGPLLDNLFWTDNRSESIDGPFETEEDLNYALVKKASYNNLPTERVAYYRRHLPHVLRGHPPIFTHGDFQKKNVIVCPTSNLNNDNNESPEYEVVLIDWEFAGWYPCYWEYSRAIYSCGTWTDDWGSWVDKILDPFPNESVWMGVIIRELWS